MSDIVERLVALANSLGGTEGDDIMAGLAEIERLRAELALYKQNYARKQLTDSERRALEGK